MGSYHTELLSSVAYKAEWLKYYKKEEGGWGKAIHIEGLSLRKSNTKDSARAEKGRFCKASTLAGSSVNYGVEQPSVEDQ
jgi:hypothetical protein